MLKTYYNYDVNLTTLYPSNSPSTTYTISKLNVVGWSLVYVGVSVGIGLVGGLLSSLLLYLFERKKRNYNDWNLFTLSYELRPPQALV